MEKNHSHGKACKTDLPIEYLMFTICLAKDSTQTERKSLPQRTYTLILVLSWLNIFFKISMVTEFHSFKEHSESVVPKSIYKHV